ncbi:hypothetical protein HWV62_15931 [Athelia sp. TMB]|nr:hypothetical protein HWV62_15931 [Athelia sp. TMB]
MSDAETVAATVICGYTGGPPMNTDISGVGAARSGSKDDITGAEYTLIATNIAMAITALLLGLQPEPDISFHEFGDIRILQLLSVLQSIVVFAFALAVLITAPRFGSNPECNTHAVLAFFGHFPVFNAGRIVGGTTGGIVIVLYVCMTARDYLSPLLSIIRQKRAKDTLPIDVAAPQPRADAPIHIPQADLKFDVQDNVDAHLDVYAQLSKKGEDQTSELNFNGTLTLQLIAILILWAIAVMNTELLIVWNHFEKSDSPQSMWQFGQVLPLLLIIVPFVGMVKVFKAHGLRKIVKSEKDGKKDV